MFTGIIETTGEVLAIQPDRGNVEITVGASIASALRVDQSVAHNGVCLTVTAVHGDSYRVTVIAESLRRTNLGTLKPGDPVNLERCLEAGARLDGHIVQGHADTTGVCDKIEDDNGSKKFFFSYAEGPGLLTVAKGSICVNGVSLTVVDSSPGQFSVAIIPYTMEHTTFGTLKPGDTVNLEFDIIGKYITALVQPYQ